MFQSEFRWHTQLSALSCQLSSLHSALKAGFPQTGWLTTPRFCLWVPICADGCPALLNLATLLATALCLTLQDKKLSCSSQLLQPGHPLGGQGSKCLSHPCHLPLEPGAEEPRLRPGAPPGRQVLQAVLWCLGQASAPILSCWEGAL